MITGQEKPIGGFELYAWIFMRISGVVLLFLAIIHFIIMHVITKVENVNYEFVVNRFNTPFWRIYDLIMLFLALLHGANGVRILIDDYIKNIKIRNFLMIILYILTIVFLLIGTYVLVIFR